jgi:maltokinase
MTGVAPDERDVTHTPADDELLTILRDWLPTRRWFPAKGVAARLECIGGLTLADPRGEASVRVLLVRVRAPDIDSVLQVPVTVRAPTGLRDDVDDPAFLRAWLAAADGPGAVVDPDRARVLSGEQSNSSVVLPALESASESESATPAAILKVFRTLTPGDNPDVDVPRALAAAGWAHVARPLAWLETAWSVDGERVRGYLGVLSEFVPDAHDGFELACSMVRRGESFTGLAASLGATIAEMHEALARALPTPAPEPGLDRGDDLARSLRERFRWAAHSVPALDRYAADVERLATGTRALDIPPAPQRIHGDLHLGQVLHAATGWFVLDFEGEPLAPVTTRTRPDLALRDVAGMLRSIDYAAAVGGSGGAAALTAAERGWADEARRSLLTGYFRGPTRPDAETALRALEVEKALYEAVYEARNRPTWLAVPLAALDRLLTPTTPVRPG